MKLHQIVEVPYEEYKKITSGQRCYLSLKKWDTSDIFLVSGDIYSLHCHDNPEDSDLIPFAGNHEDLRNLLAEKLLGPENIDRGIITIKVEDRYLPTTQNVPLGRIMEKKEKSNEEEPETKKAKPKIVAVSLRDYQKIVSGQDCYFSLSKSRIIEDFLHLKGKDIYFLRYREFPSAWNLFFRGKLEDLIDILNEALYCNSPEKDQILLLIVPDWSSILREKEY